MRPSVVANRLKLDQRLEHELGNAKLFVYIYRNKQIYISTSRRFFFPFIIHPSIHPLFSRRSKTCCNSIPDIDPVSRFAKISLTNVSSGKNSADRYDVLTSFAARVSPLAVVSKPSRSKVNVPIVFPRSWRMTNELAI